MSEARKYVVAVSGGVDSVVLLNMIMQRKISEIDPAKIVVAHFDHGIRAESAKDAHFVRGLAHRYKVPFEHGREKLGEGASEATAREVRYKYLRHICKKYKAPTIVTAHHQDDLVETLIINLLRGTNWRGLTSLKSDENIYRPLLNHTKTELITYAKSHHLKWREDDTNQNTDYLRNYARNVLIPYGIKKDHHFTKKLVDLSKQTTELRISIDDELESLTGTVKNPHELSRYQLVMWTSQVAREVIYHLLTKLDPTWHPSALQLIRAEHFVKTAKADKSLEVSKRLVITSHNRTLQFKKV